MKILARLEKTPSSWFLIIISFVFFLLRFPSLFEPNWYGDEGIYQTLGLGMNAGRLLYKGVFDNKPPLLYLLYSFVSADEFAIRLVSLIFGMLSVIIFFFLAKKILENTKAIYLSTAVFTILFGLPLIEGNIANAENFMLLPNILAAFLVLKALDVKQINHRYSILLSSGFLLGLSFLFKIVAVFDFGAFFLFLFFANYSKKLLDIIKPENLIKEIKNLLPFILGFLAPILLTVLYFIFNNALPDFLKATFLNNVGYVGYGNKFIIPQGFLIFKLILLGSFSLFVFRKRLTLGNTLSFTCLWLAFSLFNAFFSQRPYTHYVLVILPSFCLILGFILLKKNLSKFAALLTIACFIVVLLSFHFYIKTAVYYQNFVSFIVGQKDINAYRHFFDGSTPRDYEIAAYINLYSRKSDNLFVWGNNAQVYQLTNKLPPGKYTVAYHITGYKDGFSNTQTGLEKNQPKFIVLMPNAPTYPFSLRNYSMRINIEGVRIYEKLFK